MNGRWPGRIAISPLVAIGPSAYYGDAGSEAILLRAGVVRARTLVVAVNDLVAARAAIRHARRLNPAIGIVTRATTSVEIAILGSAGADEVVQPEFEAGLEFVRHVLRRHGVSARETTTIVGHRRSSFYSLDQDEDL